MIIGRFSTCLQALNLMAMSIMKLCDVSNHNKKDTMPFVIVSNGVRLCFSVILVFVGFQVLTQKAQSTFELYREDNIG